MAGQEEARRLAAFGATPGTDVEPEGPTYAVVPYFGTDIRVLDDGDVLLLDLEEFVEQASQIESDGMAALAMIRVFLRRLVHPDDFATFWKLVRANKQNLDAQMGFAKYVIEEMTGHPTPLPSDSSPGRQDTVANSEDELSLRAQRRLEAAGRPDLAMAVLQAREWRLTHAAATG